MNYLIILTGETRHRYIEDTLLCLGAPEGYIVKFNYNKKYLPTVSEDEIKKYKKMKVILVSYRVDDQKQHHWIPIRLAEVLESKPVGDELFLALKLEKLITANTSFHSNHNKITYDRAHHVVKVSELSEADFNEESFEGGFEKIVDLLVKFSATFKNQDVAFASFDLSSDGKAIDLSTMQSKNFSKIEDPIFQPSYNLPNSYSELQLRVRFYSPEIQTRNHLFRLRETFSSEGPCYTDFAYGSTRDQFLFPLSVKRGLKRRSAEIAIEAPDWRAFCARPKLTFRVNASCTQISMLAGICIAVSVPEYFDLVKALPECLVPWVKFVIYLCRSVATLYVVRYFIRG